MIWDSVQSNILDKNKKKSFYLKWLLVLLSCPLCSCSYVRVARSPHYPDALRDTPVFQTMQSPQEWQQAYARLFPPVPSIKTPGGEVHASRPWIPGDELYDFNFFALDPANLRFRLYYQQQLALDFLAREGMVWILFPTDRLGFTGPLRPEETIPIAEGWGLQPWDLVDMLLIGQRIAMEHWRRDPGWLAIYLYPMESAPSGLISIALDKESGLPRRATWRRGVSRWRVYYDEWAHPSTEVSHEFDWPDLVPKRLTIRGSQPDVVLEINLNEFEFEAEFNPALLQLGQAATDFQFYPLERLDDYQAVD